MGLVAAIRAWQPERGPFPAFADRCVSNHALLALAAACRRKHQLLTRAVSLDSPRPGAGAADARPAPSLLDTLPANRDARTDPESRLLVREQLTDLLNAIETLTRARADRDRRHTRRAERLLPRAVAGRHPQGGLQRRLPRPAQARRGAAARRLMALPFPSPRRFATTPAAPRSAGSSAPPALRRRCVVRCDHFAGAPPAFCSAAKTDLTPTFAGDRAAPRRLARVGREIAFRRQRDRELGDVGLSKAVVRTQRAQGWSSPRNSFSARPGFRRRRPPRPARPLAGSLRERS